MSVCLNACVCTNHMSKFGGHKALDLLDLEPLRGCWELNLSPLPVQLDSVVLSCRSSPWCVFMSPRLPGN